MLTVDYGDDTDFENRQKENTFRSVASWDHVRENWKMGAKAGYIHTKMNYDYKRIESRLQSDFHVTSQQATIQIRLVFQFLMILL